MRVARNGFCACNVTSAGEAKDKRAGEEDGERKVLVDRTLVGMIKSQR